MNKKFFILLAFVACLATTISAQKIAYLDTDTLLTLMPEVKKADSTLARYREDMQKVYTSYVMEYQQAMADYQANAASWSEVMREAAEEDLAKMQLRINEYEQQSTDRLSLKKAELYDPILSKVRTAIKQVGDENKFATILDKGNMLYVGTDAVDVLPLVKKKLGIV